LRVTRVLYFVPCTDMFILQLLAEKFRSERNVKLGLYWTNASWV